MDEEKYYDMIYDAKSFGVYSDCCCADVIWGDICSECKEHCEPINEEDEL